MKKILLGIFALGIFQASHAQKKEKVNFKTPVIKKDKQTVSYVNGKKVPGSRVDAPPPPPPPLPPLPPQVLKAPPPPPPPPPPPHPSIKKEL